ncbi:MAG: hypothetical protein JWM00_698 [Candidatus Saccharibacteria bacterium]|nr:hypothetical protein [Candidatus Saccharibacteria bacterium]
MNEETQPNSTNRANRATKKTYVLVVVSVVAAIVVLYGLASFALGLWPFNTAQTSETTPSKSSPKISMQAPVIDPSTKVLHTSTTIDTKEQGSCTLTLSNEKNKYVLKNTTEGVSGKSGCLDWNIGTGSILAGDYDVSISFDSKTQSSTVTSKVTIP